jgi:hypothetical protein
MKRREFITLLGGAAAWPLAARAQQPARIRRIGVLTNLSSDDAEGQARNAAFLQGLQELGWTVGRNVRIDYRWGAIDADRSRRHAAELVAAVTAFAGGSNGGLIVTGSTLAAVHRELIITLAARHQLPAVYPFRYFVTGGGLISYGPDNIEPFRRAAGYVDRILKGEKPADLPVQEPTKYQLVINLKTATALGLEVPPTVLARADEVIE